MKSLDFRSEIYWICSGLFFKFVKDWLTEKYSQIKCFIREIDGRDIGLVMGKYWNGRFFNCQQFFSCWKIIQPVLNKFDFMMNHFNIFIDLLDKNLNITLNNDGECTSKLIQYSDNINLKVLCNLLSIII